MNFSHKFLLIAFLTIFPLSSFSLGCNQKTPPANINQPPTIQISEKEKEKLKTEAENFVRIYTSYRWGEFRNLEDLKDKMTARLWQEKSRWIETKKQELVNQPKRYLTFYGNPKQIKINWAEANNAEIEVDYIQTEIKGAMIQGEITIKYVNEFGEEKPMPPPLETQKKIRLKFIRETNKWKVDEIIIVKN